MMRHKNFALTVAVAALLAGGGCAQTQGLFGGGEAPQVKEQMGDEALAAGNLQQAAELYNAVVMAHPDYMPARVKLGNALLRMNRPNDALPHFTTAAQANPNDYEAVKGAGKAYIALGNGEAAIPYFEQALSLQPTPGGYAALGVGYDLSGRHQEAQGIYRNGLRTDPQHLSLRNNMGLSLLLSGDPDGAISVLQSVVNSPAATAQHRSNLALAYGVLGKENAAQRMLEKDLSTADVSRNLAVYDKIRGMNGQSLRQAVLLGDAENRKASIDE